MNQMLIVLIRTISQILTLLIIADALLSFILAPYHPVRATLGRILQPIYAPIRKILPSTGMIDFTPLIVLILIQVIEAILISILL
ncbi:MAG: YggT family protein [Chloroflexi bacterium]|nr:YggT family protein [Chloroflexota bacterium]